MFLSLLKVSKIDEIFYALFMIESEVIKVNSNDQAINYLIDAISFFSVNNYSNVKRLNVYVYLMFF